MKELMFTPDTGVKGTLWNGRDRGNFRLKFTGV